MHLCADNHGSVNITQSLLAVNSLVTAQLCKHLHIGHKTSTNTSTGIRLSDGAGSGLPHRYLGLHQLRQGAYMGCTLLEACQKLKPEGLQHSVSPTYKAGGSVLGHSHRRLILPLGLRYCRSGIVGKVREFAPLEQVTRRS